MNDIQLQSIRDDHRLTPEVLEKFTKIWKDENINHKRGIEKKLDDDMYILYNAWVQVNCIELYKIHKPNTVVIQGQHRHIIFHGGCLDCPVQYTHGVNTCKRCFYFKCNGKYPDLSDGNVPPETITENVSILKSLMRKPGGMFKMNKQRSKDAFQMAAVLLIALMLITATYTFISAHNEHKQQVETGVTHGKN